jgi:DNA modification methylase
VIPAGTEDGGVGMGVATRIRQRKRRPQSRAKLQHVEVRRSLPITSPTKTKFTLLKGDALEAIQQIPHGSVDLIVSSPPYNIGKQYERKNKLSFSEYVVWQDQIIANLVGRLKDTGSVCWQIGSHVSDGECFPLDVHFYDSFKKRGLKLRNRIIWKFNFGLNSSKRFSGRYETILWFTKSDSYKFNLDPVRIPQLYPGKRHPKNRGKSFGKLSGNPRGKNPGDYWEFSAEKHFLTNTIWDVPNVKANHPEKTIHPCQFPVELVERCVLAFTDKHDVVLDPFVGTGTSVIAAIKHGRQGIGIDKDAGYLHLARKRLLQFKDGKLKLRPIGKPIHKPRANDKVAKMPEEWLVK